MSKKPTGPTNQSAADSLTILICGDGFSASKTISHDKDQSIEIKGFSAGKFFGVITRAVTDIEELSVNLQALEEMPNAFVVRGSPVTPADKKMPLPRRKANFVTPKEGKCWVMLDFDKVPLPSDLDITGDQKAVMEHLVGRLPAEFQNVTYHYQLSSSAGFTALGTVSAHVWFWLSSPCTDAALKRWAKEVNNAAKCKLVDPALFNDVQPHYTAAPRFTEVENPFPVRSGLVSKAEFAVKLRVPQIVALPVAGPRHALDTANSAGFKNRFDAIGDQEGGEGFHNAIISAIASFVSENGRDKIDPEELYLLIRDQVLAADRSKHDETYVETMASREHIVPAITGALEKFGDRPASRRRSKLVKGIATPAKVEALSSKEGHAALSVLLDSIIGKTPP